MKRLSETDEKLVSRFVDGELTGNDLADFERRVLQDQALREAVDAQRQVRGWFAGQRGGDHGGVSHDFTERVLAEARRLPSREALAGEQGVLGETELHERRVMRTGRALLAAAVVILGVSLLFASDLLRRSDSRYLEAQDERRIEELDREIEAEARRAEEALRRPR